MSTAPSTGWWSRARRASPSATRCGSWARTSRSTSRSGAIHRLENPGKVDLHLIEVQSGPYLGEDDIMRYEDVYART